MKKFLPYLLSLLVAIMISSCSNQANNDVAFLGVNVEVTDVDYDNKVLTVSSIDDDFDKFGEIKIWADDEHIIIVKKGENPEQYPFDDIKIGDTLAINIRESQINEAGQTGQTQVESIEIKNSSSY